MTTLPRVTPPLTPDELRELLGHTAAFDDPDVKAETLWRVANVQRVCTCPSCRKLRGE